MQFTAIIEKSEDGWFVGQIEEIPAAISQGKTIEELKSNLLDALKLLLEANKESTEKEYEGKDVIRERLLLVQ
jgi:predicted RNase H-like HicB family nuclease